MERRKRKESGCAGRAARQYEGWDERVAGQVTAEYELDGRKALGLSIPGYRCQGGGVVLLSIVVSPGASSRRRCQQRRRAGRRCRPVGDWSSAACATPVSIQGGCPASADRHVDLPVHCPVSRRIRTDGQTQGEGPLEVVGGALQGPGRRPPPQRNGVRAGCHRSRHRVVAIAAGCPRPSRPRSPGCGTASALPPGRAVPGSAMLGSTVEATGPSMRVMSATTDSRRARPLG